MVAHYICRSGVAALLDSAYTTFTRKIRISRYDRSLKMANLVGMPDTADMSKYDYLRGNLTMTILALGSVYVVSAFAEEIIYRGFLITRISELAEDRKSACRFAIVFSSLSFGLVLSSCSLRLGSRWNGTSELHGLSPGHVVSHCQTQSVGDYYRPRLHGNHPGSANVLSGRITRRVATKHS